MVEKTLEKIGASEGIRTLDNHLGKVTLYQAELRSRPNNRKKSKGSLRQMQALFLFEIGHDDLLAIDLENLRHEFLMTRVDLVGILRRFVRELNVKGNLVGLVDH